MLSCEGRLGKKAFWMVGKFGADFIESFRGFEKAEAGSLIKDNKIKSPQ